MILARLSYEPFDKIHLQTEHKPKAVREVVDALLKVPDIKQSVLMKEDYELLWALSKCGRYENMFLTNYVNRIEEKNQTQFSAVTVQISDDLSYISFRGTDNTLAGWKENFNMTFICPVPAQVKAVEYLESVSASSKGQLIVGGHSKGGNLAMYASSFCSRETQDRILSVYNFDGPGFDEKILSMVEYQNICSRMVTFVPQSSIVGLLLEHNEQYIIVRSEEKREYMQHDIYSWMVERNHLFYLEQVTNSSRFIDHTLKGWLADMSVSQREKFVDAMYAILIQTNVHTLQEMDERWFESTRAILHSIGNMDGETKKLITESLSLLMKNVKKSLAQAGEIWAEKK